MLGKMFYRRHYGNTTARCSSIRIHRLYILFSYIKNDADIPPEIWSEYLSSTLRTTNNYESFHRKLNSSFNSSRPNIYNFIDILKNIQIDTYIALQSQGSRNRITIEKGYIKKKKKKWKN
jgi:hypothetical protein